MLFSSDSLLNHFKGGKKTDVHVHEARVLSEMRRVEQRRIAVLEETVAGSVATTGTRNEPRSKSEGVVAVRAARAKRPKMQHEESAAHQERREMALSTLRGCTAMWPVWRTRLRSNNELLRGIKLTGRIVLRRATVAGSWDESLLHYK